MAPLCPWVTWGMSPCPWEGLFPRKRGHLGISSASRLPTSLFSITVFSVPLLGGALFPIIIVCLFALPWIDIATFLLSNSLVLCCSCMCLLADLGCFVPFRPLFSTIFSNSSDFSLVQQFFLVHLISSSVVCVISWLLDVYVHFASFQCGFNMLVLVIRLYI